VTVSCNEARELATLLRQKTLAKLLPRGRYSFNQEFRAQSPATPAAKATDALRVGPDWAWSDSVTGKRGSDVVTLAAYVWHTDAGDALMKLAAFFTPGDHLVDRIYRPGDGDHINPYKPAKKPKQDKAIAGLAKASVTPKQRADALLERALQDSLKGASKAERRMLMGRR
jgi:hypothetical protein